MALSRPMAAQKSLLVTEIWMSLLRKFASRYCHSACAVVTVSASSKAGPRARESNACHFPPNIDLELVMKRYRVSKFDHIVTCI